MANVAIIGASGYSGAELLRLCAGHPHLDVTVATGNRHAGEPIRDLYPHLTGAYPDTRFDRWDPQRIDGLDVAFIALPYGASQHHVGALLDAGVLVIDLGADFRLPEPGLYQRWYGDPHQHPELLDQFTCGIAELHRDTIASSTAITIPGCMAHAAILAATPALRAGIIGGPLIVDAICGLSGAGRPPRASTTYAHAADNAGVYQLDGHEHTPEIEHHTGTPVLFTAHRVPMTRGILATCHATSTATTGELLDALRSFYRNDPFITVSDHAPSTKDTRGSNSVHLTARVDERTGIATIVAALDNLGKGAAGAAVQCANIALGLDEQTGLTVTGLYP